MRLNKWSVALFFGLFYLFPSATRGLWIPDEARYAEISREMLATGHWIVPHLLGLRYFEKPVLGYWLNNLSQLIFGHDNFAVRFASVAATAASAALVAWLARRFWHSAQTAIAASLIYLSMLLVYGVGTMSVLDAMFSFWMTAAMATFCLCLDARTPRARIARYIVFGLACGAGFLTKGFIALALPVVAILPYMIYRRRFTELVVYGPVAVIAAAVISAPWAIWIQLLEPDYWRYFFWVQHIKRFAGAHAQHAGPVWYYLPLLLAGSLPWLGVAPVTWWHAWRERREAPEFIYLLCWLLFPLLFFSAAKGKLPTYILPCFAPLALLAGHGVMAAVDRAATRVLRVNGAINIVFGLIGVGAVYWLSRPDQHIYGAGDTWALALGLVSFAGWSLFGLVQLRWPLRGWAAAALCPGVLALLLAWALPQSVIDAKQPGWFINAHAPAFTQAVDVLTNDDGVAYSLAWALDRSDIKLLDNRGELAYGLDYPDVPADKNIARDAFPGWLRKTRHKGKVVLLLKFHRRRTTPAQYTRDFPPGYKLTAAGDFILLVYPPTTT